jgi:beta-galactosidase
VNRVGNGFRRSIMYPFSIRGGSPTSLRSLKPASLQLDSQPLGFRYLGSSLPGGGRLWAVLLMLMVLVASLGSIGASAQPAPPASNRITINLSAGVPNFVGNAGATDPNAALPQSNWWYENNQDNTAFANTGNIESAVPAADAGASCGQNTSAANWFQVGIPNDANIWRTFINQASGGGQGSLCGQNNWYRLHFKVDPSFANDKIEVEIEGAHTGVQVYINGTLLTGISAVGADAQASHVVGFIPFVVDLTPYLHADGATDNVLAVRVSRGNSWYEDPGFSEVFRFGQAMAGLYRPVKMFITNKVHIPVNVYSNQKTWGTYVATVSASSSSAVIQVEANVLNETTSSQLVTLTNQIVDANGNVVATGTAQTQTIGPMSPGNFPSSANPMFSQQITVNNPTLWYPNSSTYGTPYLYTVNHIVSVNGTVVDVQQSPLGIRTITWNADYPIINGHPMNLWGGAGRYDYPGLGSSVPEEQQWRDLSLLAAEGGNIYRPGHSSSSEEFVNAADAYGIFIVQPSGDGEEAFAAANNPSADMVTLKEELHRDMIIRDRSHPSILSWESNNGIMEESIGTALLGINSQWDPINTRVATDRTPDPVNGTLLGCTLEGCEVLVKQTYPNNPAWGAEYWGTGTARGLAWNYELAFVAPFLDNWQKGRAAGAMGMVQWYLIDTPGETGQFVEAGTSTTAPGNSNAVRSLGASSMDQNRFPKLLYYAYEAAWTPFSIKPVVHLAGHWNLGGNVQVNAFSNCPSVKLLVNGAQQGSIETPNAWNSNDEGNQTESATQIPFQVSWNVNWASGTVTAQCLNASGTVVATDSRTTAGGESKIVLAVIPELTKPNGTAFQVTANGSDAAFVTATIEDANGNWEPLASDNVTFSVSGPATYQGGTEQYLSTNTNAYSNANSSYVGGVPDAFYHSPGDPELQVEGGMTRIAVRSQFTAGNVTVTATAPGLASGSATFTIVPVPDPRTNTTTSCTTLPSAPTGLGATVSSGVVSLTWTAVNPPANCTINSYSIYRSTTSGFAASSSNQIASGVGSASYADTSVAASTTYYYVVEAVDADGASAASAQASATTGAGGGTTEAPYPGPSAAAVPGTEMAENYDTGGQGVAYNITSTNGTANTYRSQGVDLEAATAPATGDDLGWSAAGQWFRYTVNVSTAGTYTISFLVASPTAVADAFHLSNSSGTNLSGSVNVPATGGYQTWVTVTASVTLPAGQQTLTLSDDAAGWNIDSMAFALTSGGGTGTPVIEINSGGAATGSWVADTDFTGGTAVTTTNTITTSGVTDPAPQAVYQSNRYNAPTYTIGGLTAGTSYTVRLHFAETYWTAAGEREFNVSINGTQVLTNFDIFKTAGGENIANVQQFTATANSSGQIVITSANVVDYAQFNGIEVDQSGTTQTCKAVPPTGPATLTATASSSSVIGLSWPTGFTNPPCTVTGYDVFRGTTNGFTPGSGNLIASGVTSTTYSDTGLAASTTYYYLVETLDSYGASAASPQASATTASGGGTTEGPYPGPAAAAVPGTVMAENYDTGGQGVAYNVTSTNGTANTYRTGGVDLEAATAPATGNDLGWSAAGQWFRYTVNASTAGTYTVSFLVASPTAVTDAFHLSNSSGTNLSGSVAVPATGGYQTWVTVKANVTLPAGQQTLTLSEDAAGWNIDSMAFASGSTGTPVIQIDCGGAASSAWVADTDFTGGTTVTSTNAITTSGVTNPAPQAVYQSNRYNAPTYTIGGLTSGTSYTVRLHFAETYWTAAAKREFNVSINGAQVLTNFDIFATAGGENIANVQQFTATANSSGQIVITSTNVVDNAQFNGIEVDH